MLCSCTIIENESAPFMLEIKTNPREKVGLSAGVLMRGGGYRQKDTVALC